MMLEGLLSSVFGNTSYDIVKRIVLKYFGQEDKKIVDKVYSAFEKSSEKFFLKFGDTFGEKSNSFLAREENWEKVLSLILYDVPEIKPQNLNWEGFDGTRKVTYEAASFFVETVKFEMRKDIELNQMLSIKRNIETTQKIWELLNTLFNEKPEKDRMEILEDVNFLSLNRTNFHKRSEIKSYPITPNLSLILNEEAAFTWSEWMNILDKAKNSHPKTRKLLTDTLIKLASDTEEEPDIRRNAIFCLKYFEIIEHNNKILALLKDNNENVRRSAASAVGELKIMEGYDLLVQILESPNEHRLVKSCAAISLGLIGKSETCEILLRVLEKNDEDLNWYGYNVLTSLAKLDLNKEHYNRVILLLSHSMMNIRSAAANYFREHVISEAIEPLTEVLKDSEDSPAISAAKALEEYLLILRKKQRIKILSYIKLYLKEFGTADYSNKEKWLLTRVPPFYKLKELILYNNK